MSPDQAPGRDMVSTRPTVAFAHLGCEKNRVDTEHMLGLLTRAGYGVSSDESDANVVVVNTCSFIQEPGKNQSAHWWDSLSKARN